MITAHSAPACGWRVALRLAGRSAVRGWGRHVAGRRGARRRTRSNGRTCRPGYSALHAHLAADRGICSAREVVSVASGASALAAPMRPLRPLAFEADRRSCGPVVASQLL
eukprot:7384858-Prymnesium_polylepis.1